MEDELLTIALDLAQAKVAVVALQAFLANATDAGEIASAKMLLDDILETFSL